MRKILLQLWERCNNKCEFCFQNGCFTDSDKIRNIQNAIELLSSSNMKEVETINLMGGELFDFAWDDELTKAMNELFGEIKKMFDHNLHRVYLMTNFIFDSTQLDKFLESQSDIQDKISFCTSWDYQGRFRNESAKLLFFSNVEKYMNLGYEVFCSITLTDALLSAVVDDNYNGLQELDKMFGGRLSYHTPHGELFSDEKFDLDKFYPTRNLFVNFIMKMCSDGELNTEKFLNPRYYPDTYFYLQDEKYVQVNRSTLEIGSYSDSDKTMRNDYLELKGSFDL